MKEYLSVSLTLYQVKGYHGGFSCKGALALHGAVGCLQGDRRIIDTLHLQNTSFCAKRYLKGPYRPPQSVAKNVYKRGF
jgi:hypothetical protein